MQETLNSKKKGDTAFRHKDFTTAIECYTQVSLIYYHDIFLGWLTSDTAFCPHLLIFTCELTPRHQPNLNVVVGRSENLVWLNEIVRNIVYVK